MQQIRLLTLNIQKGWSLGRRASTLMKLKKTLSDLGANIVCLQEIVGESQAENFQPQFEYLADNIWPHFAYGRNAIHSRGHHGNAILSQVPFSDHKNFDLTNRSIERRGALYGRINLGLKSHDLHVFTIHLDLTNWGRLIQISKLGKIIAEHIDPKAPLIICGDFNDWTEKAGAKLQSELGLEEAYFQTHGHLARTFPTYFPFLKLDRIYYRNLSLKAAIRMDAPVWHSLSDHLGLCADFELSSD